MRKFYSITFAVLALFIHANAQTVTKVFRGTISDKPVQMTLTRRSDKLSGTYFYQRIGKDLRLAGAIEDDGRFALSEYDAKNVKTGEINGFWRNAADGSAYLEGEWKNPQTGESWALNVGEEMIFFTGKAKLINKTFEEKNKPRMFEISADYPELTGANPAAAAKFNKLIKDSVMKEVAEFRKNMLGLKAEDLKFFKQNGTEAYMEMGYMIDFANDKVISIGFGNSTYEGGAHPNHFSFTVNFDLATGKKIELADLFKPNSNYLKVISDYSIKKLKEQQEEMTNDDEWLATGAGAKAENFRSWSIKKTGIMITFDPYQVAAYAAGPQEVFIPYSELKSVLRENSLVLNL
jgi:hypothetical protein